MISLAPALGLKRAQVRAMTRVTGPVSTASTHSAGYLGYCGYDPAAASLFVVTLRCGAGLPGYLLAVVGNRGSPSSGSAGYANSGGKAAAMLEFRRR